MIDGRQPLQSPREKHAYAHHLRVCLFSRFCLAIGNFTRQTSAQLELLGISAHAEN